MTASRAGLDFNLPSPTFAAALIGARLSLDGVGGVIVETEAYERTDPASHAFRGPTRRNTAMFGPVGRVYVYRSHGLHWCLNIVCGPEPGSAVLIRALEPETGLLEMHERRGLKRLESLCSGPGKLCQALGVTGAHNDLAVDLPPFSLTARTQAPPIVTGPRIGISKAVDYPWRFGLKGSRFLSRPFKASGN